MKNPVILFFVSAVFLITMTVSTASALTPDDLYAHWSFDETTGTVYSDASNNGNDTYFGYRTGERLIDVTDSVACPPLDASCVTNPGASGTGAGIMLGYDQLVVDNTVTASLVNIPIDSTNNPTWTLPGDANGDFAVSFWVSDDVWQAERGLLVYYSDGTTAFTVGMDNVTNGKKMVAHMNLGGTTSNKSYRIMDSANFSGYHHVLAQFNSSTGVSNLFVDGVSDGNSDSGWVTTTTPTGFALGARLRAASYTITGVQIDDFAVINGNPDALAIASAGASIDTISGLDLHTHLKLDETTGSTLADSSGNGNNADLVQWSLMSSQNVTGTESGVFGTAARFDSAHEDFGQFDPNLMPIVGEEEFTVTFWMKANDWTEAGAVLSWDNEENRFTTGFNTKGEFRTYLSGTDGNVIRYIDVDENGLNLTDDTFVHVALTVDENSDIQLYLDGVLQTLSASGVSKPAALNTAMIGARGRENMTALYDTMSGALDDLAIFKGVLTQAEIQTVMGSGVAAAIPEPSTFVMLLGTLLGVLAIRRTRQ